MDQFQDWKKWGPQRSRPHKKEPPSNVPPAPCQQKFVDLHGWYYLPETVKSTNKYANSSPTVSKMLGSILLQSAWVFSVKRFDLSVLCITEIRKIQGTIFNPTDVRGVVDVSQCGSTIPFFIKEVDVPKLQALIATVISVVAIK